jgi:hydrogenase maturation factor
MAWNSDAVDLVENVTQGKYVGVQIGKDGGGGREHVDSFRSSFGKHNGHGGRVHEGSAINTLSNLTAQNRLITLFARATERINHT